MYADKPYFTIGKLPDNGPEGLQHVREWITIKGVLPKTAYFTGF
jgi:hypothetical protein